LKRFRIKQTNNEALYEQNRHQSREYNISPSYKHSTCETES
jgi:hypothetical protein